MLKTAVSSICSMLFFVALVGCDDGPKLYSVTGIVTFDGEPIQNGDMVFADPSGSKSPEGTRIIDGEFSIMMTAGEKRVEIDASKDVPGEKPPLRESFIPERFNRESELTATIEPGSENYFKFELKK